MKRTILPLVLSLFVLSACLPASPTAEPLGAIQTAIALTLTAQPPATISSTRTKSTRTYYGLGVWPTFLSQTSLGDTNSKET